MWTLIQRVAFRYLARTGAEQVVYVAVFLDPMDSRRLIKRFGQRHPNLYADHMTIWSFQNGGDPGLQNLPLGKTVSLKVIGYAADDKGQAVVVHAPTKLRPVGQIPHITLSTAAGVAPVYSNVLLSQKWDEDEARRGLPTVRGKVGWWDGNRVRFDLPA